MTKPTRNWLLDPVFPTTAAVPHLSAEMRALAEMGEASEAASSGTWLVGSRLDSDDEDEPRFATSDTEAPTVRPGSLHAAKSG
jgi:hypothetical protein